MRTFILALVLGGLLAGCAPESRAFREEAPPSRKETTPPESRPEQVKSASRATEDTEPPSLPEGVPGRDISRLPRYPGSVRVEYELERRDGLVFIRTKYLSRDSLEAIRGFYRGVFRSGGWMVGNVEYSGDEWSFLVVHGGREASIALAPRPPNSEIEIQFSKRQPVEKFAPAPVPEDDDDGYDEGELDD